MNPMTFIAERRISQAIQEGTLDFSQWKNKPLVLEDDSFIPDDLKMAYKLLKNAGYVPPEVEAKKEIRRIEDLIAKTEDEHLRLKQMKKLSLLLIEVDAKRKRPLSIEAQDDYYARIVERISLHSDKKSDNSP